MTPLRYSWIRRPVRREGAERYLFVTLVSFAATVIATRWFLSLTGFPRIGGGDLHIAHALWGGVALCGRPGAPGAAGSGGGVPGRTATRDPLDSRRSGARLARQ